MIFFVSWLVLSIIFFIFLVYFIDGLVFWWKGVLIGLILIVMICKFGDFSFKVFINV